MTQSDTKTTDSPWEIEVFYDGHCPLCVREMKLLRWMDRKDRIVFTDIAAAGFVAAETQRSMESLMAEIHGRLPNGELITGVEVFRRLYAAVGLSPLAAITRLPGISHGLEMGYRLFARNRLRLTGRCEGTACPAPNPKMLR